MIKTWRERLTKPQNSCHDHEIMNMMQSEIDDLRAALATARKDERERCAKTAELEWHYGTANAIRNLTDEG